MLVLQKTAAAIGLAGDFHFGDKIARIVFKILQHEYLIRPQQIFPIFSSIHNYPFAKATFNRFDHHYPYLLKNV